MTTTTPRVDAAELALAPVGQERPDETATAPRRTPPVRRRVGRVLTYTALTVFAVVFSYPFIWLVSASFKPRSDVFDNLLIPKTFTLENYLTIWQEAPIGVWLVNSVIVTALAAVSVTASSALVAWGFAYFRFRGRGALFALVIGSMMLPGAVTMIPTFLIWNGLGATGTLTPLWAQNLFGSAFYIFLLRQFFLGIPRELFEAARIDGASELVLLWRIAIPLVRPALITVVLLTFIGPWNEFLWPFLVTKDAALQPLAVSLANYISTVAASTANPFGATLAGAVVLAAPAVVLFIVFQRYFISTNIGSGVKG